MEMQGGQSVGAAQSQTQLQSQLSATTFFHILKEFTDNLVARFPDNIGARSARNSLDMFEAMPVAHEGMVDKWHAFVIPIAHHIRDKNGAIVGEAFDSCEIALIREIGARDILHAEDVDEETKESVWRYIQSLTNLSMKLKAAPAPALDNASAPGGASAGTPFPTQPPPPQAQAQPQPQAQAPKTDPSQIVSGITEAFPKILQGLNDVLKSNEGDNPLAQMLKTMMNPDQVQPGMANNVMANLMQQDRGVMAQTPPVLAAAQQTGMTPEDIVRKLERLENFERARARRRGERSKRSKQ